MGGGNKVGAAVPKTISRTKAVTDVLKFYRALGFERMPFELPECGLESAQDKAEALERLRHKLGDCHRCRLSEGRANIVFGEGNPEAELMFIGETPDISEDADGRPFRGEAGDLLDKMLARMGFRREDIYIANIIKCRPKGDRNPEEDEIETCKPFLRMQAHIVRPKIIVTMGRTPTHTLLNSIVPINKLRGKVAEFEGITLMPTLHPAYLLKNTSEKVSVWNDMLKVLGMIGRKPVR